MTYRDSQPTLAFASQLGSYGMCTFVCRPRMRFAKKIQKIEKELMDGAMASGAMKQPKFMHGESHNSRGLTPFLEP